MFHKIVDVHTAVFQYFSQRLKKELGVNVRYARKSSHDYTEEQPQQVYPCVAIQDYMPTPREDWWIEHHPFYRSTSTDGTTAYLYYLPLWMDFRYDISIASKSYKEYTRLQQWFLENTIAMDEITLESYEFGGMETGEPIPIETRAQDVPRTDGVYETNYEVTFNIWLYVRQPEGIEAVQELAIKLHRLEPYIPPEPKPLPDFNADYNEDYTITYQEQEWHFPVARITDGITEVLLTLDGYEGICVITREDYDALAEKDPCMIYVIQ